MVDVTDLARAVTLADQRQSLISAGNSLVSLDQSLSASVRISSDAFQDFKYVETTIGAVVALIAAEKTSVEAQLTDMGVSFV